MKTLLALIALAVLAFLGSRFARSWLRGEGRSSHVALASGAGYVLLGLALGRLGANLLSQGVLQDLLPLIGFALAWVGVLLGAQLRIPQLRKAPPRLFYLAFLIVLVPFVVVGAGVFLAGAFWAPLRIGWAGIALLAVAAATLSIPAFGLSLKRGAPEPLARLLLALGGLANVAPVLLALVLSGVWLAVEGGLSPLGSSGVVLALGLGSGALLWLSLGLKGTPRRDQFLLLLGVVTLTGGLATIFQLSPLGIGFLAGAFYTNLGGKARSWSVEKLGQFERPIYLGLLLVAGARVPHQDWGVTLPLLGLFLVLHVAGNLAGGHLLSRGVERGRAFGLDLRAALLPQGAIGLAVLIEARILYPEWISDATVAVLVLGFLILETAAPYALSRIVGERRAGET